MAEGCGRDRIGQGIQRIMIVEIRIHAKHPEG
jgi:hypothetical protein